MRTCLLIGAAIALLAGGAYAQTVDKDEFIVRASHKCEVDRMDGAPTCTVRVEVNIRKSEAASRVGYDRSRAIFYPDLTILITDVGTGIGAEARRIGYRIRVDTNEAAAFRLVSRSAMLNVEDSNRLVAEMLTGSKIIYEHGGGMGVIDIAEIRQPIVESLAWVAERKRLPK